ncbi:DUF805 domain-containing protein [Bacteroides pyogenes]|uniref:DUF805 domain-containing protein n=1 Tax=Bacteroides pyogenes TaxID=310300 RepID=UPI003B435DA9
MFKAPFSLNGRIRRIEYFLSGLIAALILWAAILLAALLWIIPASDSNLSLGIGATLGSLLACSVWGAIIWFSLAQSVKRLHDLDKSGWFILLCFIPVVGWIFALYMLFADGTVGPNRYGDDPKNRMPYHVQPAPVNVTVNIAKDGTVRTETQSVTPDATPSSGEIRTDVSRE